MFGIVNERKEHVAAVRAQPAAVASATTCAPRCSACCCASSCRVAGVERAALSCWCSSSRTCPTGCCRTPCCCACSCWRTSRVVLCGALHARSEGHDVRGDHRHQHGRELFMFMVGALPGIHDHMSGAGAGVELHLLDGARRANSPCSSSPSPCPSSSPRAAATSSRGNTTMNNHNSPITPARARRGARLRPVVRRGLSRRALLHAGMAARASGP